MMRKKQSYKVHISNELADALQSAFMKGLHVALVERTSGFVEIGLCEAEEAEAEDSRSTT